MSDLMHPPSHRVGLTIVLKAFLDASDPRENIPVAVVAGFVSTVTCWESFEAQWTPLMRELGLARWHTSDFRNRRNQYESWPDARFPYAKGQVLKIMNSCRQLGVGCAIDVNVFEEWRAISGYYINPDPYYFCLDKCLSKLIRGISEPIDEGIAIYCDRDHGREKIGLTIAEWHEERLRRRPYNFPQGPTKNREITTHYGSCYEYVPIQAADILSNDTYVRMRGLVQNSNFEEPDFIAGLKSGCMIITDYFNDRELIEIDSKSKFRRDEV